MSYLGPLDRKGPWLLTSYISYIETPRPRTTLLSFALMNHACLHRLIHRALNYRRISYSLFKRAGGLHIVLKRMT